MQPYYQDAWATIYHGDCREIMPQLTDSVDLVLTDPPFNVGKKYGEQSRDNMCAEDYYSMLAEVATMSERHAWICPHIHIHKVFELLYPAVPIIITRGAQGPFRGGWYDQFQMAIVRGQPLVRFSNLWEDIRLVGEGYFYDGETFGHKGTTPYKIMRRLCRIMTEPHAVILDPFVGTGTSLRAAKDLGRRAIGIESVEHWCEVSAKRLEQEVLPLVFA